MKRENELTLTEWDKILASLGRAPYWFTISGGEPLMYPHIVELAQLAYRHCRPAVINIPSNAILSSIPDRVSRIAESCPDSQIIINLSLDGIGKKHDHIRGIQGNFEKFEQRMQQLSSLRQRLPNLTVGIHSVISSFNWRDVAEIIGYADRSPADQFITEIAEPRVELDTVGLPITPDPAEYGDAIDRVLAYVKAKKFKGIARFTEALRVEYYKLVKRILEEKDQVIECYAGWISTHIYADGTVWPCCIRADDIGNLRNYDYDFKRIWFGSKIREVRRSIAARECHCTLANASYTNLLEHVPTMMRVTKDLLASGFKRENRNGKAGHQSANATAEPSQRNGTLPARNDKSQSAVFAWLDTFQHKAPKSDDYAKKALDRYALGIKGKGALQGVVAEPGPNCCEAASRLTPGKVYSPAEAPQLPLLECTQGNHCDCVYRPAMKYEQVNGS
jgi:MoaA/NifB/PqqE/SkfB family radical SAM enzyme